ncbi:MAG TPA: hypothetical protein VGP63_28960 [Planctomycetaceae bacterium]|jgi:hypothetical protein|nr:hypothetical protein [Planctomycetaceae bacterium]
MMRTLWIVLSLSCVAVIVSEVAGAGVLWSRGFLTARRLREVREVFEPQEKEAVALDAEAQPVLPSSQDVLRDRSLRVLSLSSLETEVGLLKAMLETERTSLSTQNAAFQQQRAAFKAELQKLSDETAVAAREQARAVVLALPPSEAVERLMQLTVTEDVLLLREMPENKIAMLLKELVTTPEGDAASANVRSTSERRQRAQEIFKSINNGEPRNSIIRSALSNLQQGEAERPTASSNTPATTTR